MKKTVLVIGAGIAGLSTGCYGQMNGYDTRIFEMHDKPGGLCTSWTRKGYTIDGCLDFLVGSAPGLGFYRIWEELGAVQERRFIDSEEFARVEARDGKVLILYTDVDRLEQHLKELSPQDSAAIREFTHLIRVCARNDMPVDKAPELLSAFDGIKTLIQAAPFIRVYSKWKRTTIRDFAQKFSDPFLREAFSALAGNMPDFTVIGLAMPLAWMHQKSAGYAVGGSLEFAKSIEHRYLDLGGEVHYQAPVSEILVEDDRAIGVRLTDGTTHHADVVISAADGHATIFDMLGGKYVDSKVRGYYDELPLFPPLVQAAFGVARSYEGLPSSVMYLLDEPLTIGSLEQTQLTVELYNSDPTMAPPGKTVVKVTFYADYSYWQNLSHDHERYEKEKAGIAEVVTRLLDQRYPGFAESVEVTDIATPITWERYTGNWKASFEGWLMTDKTMPPFRMSKTLPGLKDFYMAGQWVEPGGGLPSAAMSGRNVMQLLCKRDKKPFLTQIP